MLPNVPQSAVGVDPASLGFVPPTVSGAVAARKEATPDKTDKKGRVYELSGKSKISTASGKWKAIEVDQIIQEGDVIITEAQSSVSIVFDDHFLNVIFVPENTRAEFRTIEPTDIFLEDGTIYNLVNGLPVNSEWKITTPTAVAAVRGTFYVIQFQAANGDFFAATFYVPDETLGETGEPSVIEVTELDSGGQPGNSVNLPEGFQLSLSEGEAIDPSLVEAVGQDMADQMMGFLNSVAGYREEHGGDLPDDFDQFFGPGGPGRPDGGSGGGTGDSPIDPLTDTTLPKEEPTTDSSTGSDCDESNGRIEGPSEDV